METNPSIERIKRIMGQNRGRKKINALVNDVMSRKVMKNLEKEAERIIAILPWSKIVEIKRKQSQRAMNKALKKQKDK